MTPRTAADPVDPVPVPVLLITGPVGAGESTVLGEAARLLREAQVPHAAVDLAHFTGAWPPPPDDAWNERLAHHNLACVWANCREAGATRLLLARVLEARSLLRHIEGAVPGARIIVVRLRVSQELLEARIRHRDQGRDPSWYLGAMAYLVDTMERSEVADYVVTNEQRLPAAVAAEVLRVADWQA